jgi:hypothetical protein
LRSKAAINAAAAILCLVLLALIQTVSVDAGLHRLLHADADSSEHQCAATLMASGQILIADSGDTFQMPLPSVLYAQPLTEIFVLTGFDRHCQSERAPPVFF